MTIYHDDVVVISDLCNVFNSSINTFYRSIHILEIMNDFNSLNPKPSVRLLMVTNAFRISYKFEECKEDLLALRMKSDEFIKISKFIIDHDWNSTLLNFAERKLMEIIQWNVAGNTFIHHLNDLICDSLFCKKQKIINLGMRIYCSKKNIHYSSKQMATICLQFINICESIITHKR